MSVTHGQCDATWAPICDQHLGTKKRGPALRARVREGVAPPVMGIQEYYPLKYFEILYAKLCILVNICAIIGPQNGSILLC